MDWAELMRAALDGDMTAYRRFLREVTPYVRAVALNRCRAAGAPESEGEDVVQEVLLAIHLKRGTWDRVRPIRPWIATITRNKLIDALRRRGRRVTVPIEDVIDILPDEAAAPDALPSGELDELIARLREPQRSIVRWISLEERSVRETAQRLAMSEGAVRVALHRALKTLAALYREQAA
nr:sigma-70 family RNA polymerase sigma factor [Ancylobacter gelatini]